VHVRRGRRAGKSTRRRKARRRKRTAGATRSGRSES
jgi:hypothetical protein